MRKLANAVWAFLTEWWLEIGMLGIAMVVIGLFLEVARELSQK